MKTYAVPLLLWALELSGLVLALLLEGWRDALAWVLLAAPIAVIVRKLARSRAHGWSGREQLTPDGTHRI